MITIKPTLKIITRKNTKMCSELCPYLILEHDNIDGFAWTCKVFGKLDETKRGMKQRHQLCLRSEIEDTNSK